MNSQQMKEEIARLTRLCKEKDVEIERLKTIPMKYRRMEFNAKLQQELSEAQAQIAMQAEALEFYSSEQHIVYQSEGYLKHPDFKHLGNDRQHTDYYVEDGEIARKSLSATSETVAAWRAKETEPLRHERDCLAAAIGNAAVKAGICSPDASLTGPHLLMLCDDLAGYIEPLRREVAMLRNVVERTSKEFRCGVHTIETSDLRTESLTDTQATALAYEREVEQRGAVKALRDAAIRFQKSATQENYITALISVTLNTWADELQEAAELRAANKGEVKWEKQ